MQTALTALIFIRTAQNMADRSPSEAVDTVIVGNGPSALILSFILHGNIPYYNPLTPHPDPILHKKLSISPCLLDVDVNDLTAHFAASRLSYSTQALPINVLLDTLIRPLNDTDPGKFGSCVEWRFEEEKVISHLVLGNTPQAGGQWADNPVSASWDIGTLSYSEMLSLPGYILGDHNQKLHGKPLQEFHRPRRREVASYLAAYPAAVGIEGAVHTNTQVGQISRSPEGFRIGSHDLVCKHLVLASGVFSNLIPLRPLLQPLGVLQSTKCRNDLPLLVVGSGFTAADVIISAPPGHKIIHIFKWDPENRPSPLRACHPRAYPEYANVYRHMKLAARAALVPLGVTSPLRRRKSNPFFHDRDWDNMYEGLPNTYIKDVHMHDESALLELETCDRGIIQREVSCMKYVIGRRGSLSYLSDDIAHEFHASGDPLPINETLISGNTLRPNVENSLQLAPDVFAIGSLTGDSLIRFSFGGCVFAAREILRHSDSSVGSIESSPTLSSENLSTAPSSPIDTQLDSPADRYLAGGHFDLHLDRQMRSLSVEEDVSKAKIVQAPDSGLEDASSHESQHLDSLPLPSASYSEPP